MGTAVSKELEYLVNTVRTDKGAQRITALKKLWDYSEKNENKRLLASHQLGLLKELAIVIRDDSGQARLNACGCTWCQNQCHVLCILYFYVHSIFVKGTYRETTKSATPWRIPPSRCFILSSRRYARTRRRTILMPASQPYPLWETSHYSLRHTPPCSLLTSSFFGSLSG